MRILLISLAIVVGLLPVTAAALTMEGGRSVVVGSGTTRVGTFTAAGGSLDLAGTFEDDVLVSGGSVTISGPVRGDVLAAGGTVRVTGEVGGSVRVLGGTVELAGKVGRNVILVGGSLTATATNEVAGEVLLLGGSATFDGHARKGIEGWVNSAYVNGTVDDHLTLRLPSAEDRSGQSFITLGPQAVVNGDFSYAAPNAAEVLEGAKVTGKTTQLGPSDVGRRFQEFFRQAVTIARVWNLLALALLAAVLSMLFPRTLRDASARMLERPGAAIGWGSLVLLAGPMTFILLPLTVAGIPLTLILIAMYIIALYCSQVVLGALVGGQLLRRLRRSGSPSSVRPSVVGGAILGTVLVTLVFDLVLSGLGEPVGTGLLWISVIVRLFFLVWPFGALLVVTSAAIRTHEQQTG